MNFSMPFGFPSWLPLLMIVMVAAYLLAAILTQRRTPPWHTEQRICPGCGASHPHFAQFCRRCGKKLG